MTLDGRLEALLRAGRLPGERNGRSKLTWEQVEHIRTLWDSGAASQATLAARFGVGKSSIRRICLRQQWKPACAEAVPLTTQAEE
jgi:hypothetical protein